MRTTPGAPSLAVRLVHVAALLVVLLPCVLSLGGCGKGARAPVGTSDHDRGREARRAAAAAQPVVGHLIGLVGERTLGPFLARAEDGKTAIVGWVSAATGNGRQVIAVPLSGVGEPRGAAKAVAEAGLDTTTLVVKSVRGKTPGYALAWTSLTERGEALWMVVVGDDAVPRQKPVELTRTNDDIVWIDVIPTDGGALCVWAEETRGGDANLMAVPIGEGGKVRGAPVRVANGAASWHAIEIPGGVGIATFAAARGAKGKAREGGALTFHRLDADGHPRSAPISVLQKPIASGDVEVARVGDRVLFAWTDRSTDEPAVTVVALDAEWRPTPPHRLVEVHGGARLLGMAGGESFAALAWEAIARRHGDTKRVYTASVTPDLALGGKPASFDVFGRAAPELVSSPGGFALVASLRDCDDGSPRCPNAEILPTLVRFDDRGVPVQREPFTFGSDPASMAWGPHCNATTCLLLTLSGETSPRVRAAEVRPRKNLAPPEPVVVAKAEGPQVSDVVAFAASERVFDLAAARAPDTVMLATLSSRAQDSMSRSRDDQSAALTVATRLASERVGEPSVLTARALAVGGVSIAMGPKPEDGGAVAWVAKDGGDPEVHVTRIDRRGRKTGEVQLTTMKGDASDVAIVWAEGGFVVAWVDGRDGNGEVYATRLGADLSRNAGERITSAPGDASDLVAVVAGDKVWLAWADPRESPRDGMADVYVAAVRPKDAKRVVDERRLLATAAHSRTPRLAVDGGAVHITWIEEAPPGLESPGESGYGAMWATLDAEGATTKRPVRLPLGGPGAASSVAVEAHDGALRAVIARNHEDGVALDAVDLSAPSLRGYPLLTLDGPPSLDVALALRDGAVYFNDAGPSAAEKRARRATIAWSPP